MLNLINLTELKNILNLTILAFIYKLKFMKYVDINSIGDRINIILLKIL